MKSNPKKEEINGPGSPEEEEGPTHQRSGRACWKNSPWCFTWEGEKAFTMVLNEEAAQPSRLGERGQGQGGLFLGRK